MHYFISSGMSYEFEKGNPRFVSGLSGTELAIETLTRTGLSLISIEVQIDYECSPEYWCGWIISYYQWRTGRSFRDIFKTISMSDIFKLYPTLNEASEEKAFDIINGIIQRKHTVSNLQQQRKKCGLSQRELSETSGINLRTLQQYELSAKDINKAAVSTVRALSKALGCKMEEILE